MIGDWGEVVTRYPYGNVRMDHLLSKENSLFLYSIGSVLPNEQGSRKTTIVSRTHKPLGLGVSSINI